MSYATRTTSDLPIATMQRLSGSIGKLSWLLICSVVITWYWLIDAFKACLLSLDSFLTGMPPSYSKPTWSTGALRRGSTPMQIHPNTMLIRIPEAGEEWEQYHGNWRNTATDKVTPDEDMPGYLDNFQGEVVMLSPLGKRLD